MKDRLAEILKELESFSEKTRKEQKKLQLELEEVATNDRVEFEKVVSKIDPTTDSVLFEIYRSLSIHPTLWIDFFIGEFRRITQIAEKADLKDQETILKPLLGLQFIARKEFDGLNKMIYELRKSLKSTSNSVVKLSIILLMDVYSVDFDKYNQCMIWVEKKRNTTNLEIKNFATQILKHNSANLIRNNIGKFLSINTWIIWFLFLVLVLGIILGGKSGFQFAGLFGAGNLLGYLIYIITFLGLKKVEFKSIYIETVIFIIITTLLYFTFENKKFLLFIIVFAIPLTINGVVSRFRK